MNFQKELQQYGLNPQDWKVQVISQKKILLQNKVDHKFCFLAQYKKMREKISIQQITLISV